jgi:hypothetical protein
MNAQTNRVLAAVALILATGVGLVEATRSHASADPLLVSGGAGAYAAARVETAFALAAEVAGPVEFELAVAEKGDRLPFGCTGPFEARSRPSASTRHTRSSRSQAWWLRPGWAPLPS